MLSYIQLDEGKKYYPGEFTPKISSNFNNYIVNNQLYFFRYKKNIVAYAPYERFAAIITPEEYNSLINNKVPTEHTPKDLLFGNFYLKKSFKRRNRIEQFNFKPEELTIFVGDACNLRCKYCYATVYRDFSKYSINEEAEKNFIHSIVDFVQKYDTIKSISFFGNGEPTLYFDLIVSITKTLKGIKNSLNFYLTTNGNFGDRRKEIVKFLVENNFYISLSFDGYKEIQDSQRPRADGKSSFEEVMKVIEEFKQYGDINKYIYPRFTLTSEALMNINKIVDFFINLGFTKIRFAELMLEGDAVKNTMQPIDLDEVVRVMPKILLKCEERGIDISGDFDPRKPSGTHPCAYMEGRAVSLDKDLNLAACKSYHPVFKIGKIENGKVLINDEQLAKLNNINIFNLPNCRECPVKCGGGCTLNSYINFKSLEVSGEREGKCVALQQILINYLIRRLT